MSSEVSSRPSEPRFRPHAHHRRAWGWVVALLLGASFVAFRLPDLTVNFQIDGQIPEYLAWSVSPQTLGKSLNPELNRHLYSFYYLGLGGLAHLVDRANLLRAAYVAEIMAIAASVYFLALTLTRNRWAAWLAVTVVIWHNGISVAPGGSHGIAGICAAQHPAIAMGLLALALSWRRRHTTAALVAGLAFNLHGSASIFVSTMVLAAAWIDLRRQGLRAILRPALVCLAAAAPTLMWVASNPPPAAAISTTEWLRFPRWIYVKHIFASSTPVRLWIMLFVFILPGILGMAARPRTWRPRSAVLVGWIAGSALLLATGYVFVEWIPVRPIAQLTLWRGTQFLVHVLLAFGLAHLLSCMRPGRFQAIAAAMTITAFITPLYPELAWIGHLGLAGLLAIAATRATGLDRMVSAALLAALCGVLYYDATCFSHIGPHLVWRWPLITILLTAIFVWSARRWSRPRQIVALAGLVAPAVWLAQLDVGRPFLPRARRRAKAILDLVPAIERASRPGDLVIAPPDIRNPGAWANRGSFLCRQQLTAYAYAPWLSQDIISRMQWYIDDPVQGCPTSKPILPHLQDGYRSRRPSDFARLRDQFGVQLAVVEHDRPLAFKAVASNDVFTLYDLRSPLP